METFLDILLNFVFALLGVLLYVVYKIWTETRLDGHFSIPSLFRENKQFWGITLTFLAVIVIILGVNPDLKPLVEQLGFAVEHSKGGFFTIGFSMAGGTDIGSTATSSLKTKN